MRCEIAAAALLLGLAMPALAESDPARLPAVEEEALREALTRAEIVARMRVSHLHGASKLCLRHPEICASGRIDARQSVRYEVVGVLRGDLEPGTFVDVDHALHPGSALLAPDAYRLDPEIFPEDRELYVLASRELRRIVSDEERYGVVAASSENEAQIRRLVAATRSGEERSQAAGVADETSYLTEALAPLVAEATLVARAEVLEIGDPPAVCRRTPKRCGDPRFDAYQWVTYRIEEVLQGEPPAHGRVRVGHVLERLDGRTLEPGEWRLSESLFRPGRIVLLLLEERARGLQPIDVDHGVLQATPENEALLHELIAAGSAATETFPSPPERAAARTEAVFRGRVLEVFAPPRPESCARTSRLRIGQQVRYEVVETWIGDVPPGTTAMVSHALAHAGSDVAVDHECRLRGDLFAPGAELVVLVSRIGRSWLWSSYTRFGVLEPGSDEARRLRAMLLGSRAEPAP